MTPNALRKRWTTTDGLSLSRRVVEAVLQKQPLNDLGLDVVDGRLDLRGFRFPTPVEVASFDVEGTNLRLGEHVGLLRLEGLRMTRVDLSAAVLQKVGFIDVELTDTLFDQADLRQIRIAGSSFNSCSFNGANLSKASLGTRHNGCRTEYRDVQFRSAMCAGSWATDAMFVGCDFSRAKLDQFDFSGSSLESCVFEGELNEVTFYGLPPAVALESGHDGRSNRMTGVDMRRAKLQFVDFRNLDLSEALLPNDEEHLVLKPFTKVLAATVEILERDDRASAQRLVYMLREGELRWATADQETGILQLIAYHPDEREILVKAIEQAKAVA